MDAMKIIFGFIKITLLFGTLIAYWLAYLVASVPETPSQEFSYIPFFVNAILFFAAWLLAARPAIEALLGRTVRLERWNFKRHAINIAILLVAIYTATFAMLAQFKLTPTPTDLFFFGAIGLFVYSMNQVLVELLVFICKNEL